MPPWNVPNLCLDVVFMVFSSNILRTHLYNIVQHFGNGAKIKAKSICWGWNIFVCPHSKEKQTSAVKTHPAVLNYHNCFCDCQIAEDIDCISEIHVLPIFQNSLICTVVALWQKHSRSWPALIANSRTVPYGWEFTPAVPVMGARLKSSCCFIIPHSFFLRDWVGLQGWEWRHIVWWQNRICFL